MIQLINSSSVVKIPEYAVAPTALEGLIYLNTGDDTLYIYYGGQWQPIIVLSPPIATGPLGISLGLANL